MNLWFEIFTCPNIKNFIFIQQENYFKCLIHQQAYTLIPNLLLTLLVTEAHINVCLGRGGKPFEVMIYVFSILTKGESYWGQWTVTVLSLTTSPGYFPVHVSLPGIHSADGTTREEDEEDISAWSRILKAVWRGTCQGRPSYQRHQTLCPFVPFCLEHFLFVCPADSGF